MRSVEHTTANFSFSFYTWIQSLKIRLLHVRLHVTKWVSLKRPCLARGRFHCRCRCNTTVITPSCLFQIIGRVKADPDYMPRTKVGLVFWFVNMQSAPRYRCMNKRKRRLFSVFSRIRVPEKTFRRYPRSGSNSDSTDTRHSLWKVYLKNSSDELYP